MEKQKLQTWTENYIHFTETEAEEKEQIYTFRNIWNRFNSGRPS